MNFYNFCQLQFLLYAATPPQKTCDGCHTELGEVLQRGIRFHQAAFQPTIIYQQLLLRWK